MKLQPEIFWMTIVMRSLCATHPNPAQLRQTFSRLAEEAIAQQLAAQDDEAWLQQLLRCRAGYEDWIPSTTPPPAEG